MTLSKQNQTLHELALKLSREFRLAETALIEVIARVERERLFQKLGRASLFEYVLKDLGHTESVAAMLIAVSRKAMRHPELRAAIASGSLSASKASRMVSALTVENATELVEFASTHTSAQIDREVARRNPGAARKPRVRQVSEDLVSISLVLPREAYERLQRVADLEAQRTGAHVDLAGTVDAGSVEYLKHRDPVEKAKRAQAKTAPPRRPCLNKDPKYRTPLTAQEKHAVFARDGGRCTHVGADGIRCSRERWLHVHHLRPVGMGGGNEPENLTTVCTTHHELAHQMAFGIDVIRDVSVPWASPADLAQGSSLNCF
jgi:5-methylcytosine-specific restriction endonuclease McrA